MSLIKFNPYSHLVSLPNELDSFFNKFGLDFQNTDSVWCPSVDVVENDNNFELKAELPGMKRNEINITFKDDVLTLSGDRKYEVKESNDHYHRIERRYGKFQRSFSLPKNVKSDAIKANYENGVLTVNIPKSEEAKPKEIAINE
ncbi:Hsp20/alpha crystallin family protein [candidate division KSB1 bacterium]|nr:Hsp20/alpha crystallin family protein [candidate division KSB1 bacterium]